MREQLVYVGTYTDPQRQVTRAVSPDWPLMGLGGPTGSDGIYVFAQDAHTGELFPRDVIRTPANPSYLALDPRGRLLYATSEVLETDGSPSGAVSSFSLDGTTPRLLSSALVGGGNPSHISTTADGRFLLVASHADGLVCVLPVNPNGTIGPPVDIRADPADDGDGPRGTHAHHAAVDPSGRWALVTNTGTDRISVFALSPGSGRLTPAEPPTVATVAGSGPRHLVFHPTLPLAYVNGEHDGSVTVLAWNAQTGRLNPRQRSSALPSEIQAGIVESNPFGRLNSAHLAVHSSGRFLLVSCRGFDSIAVFAVDQTSGALAPPDIHPLRGATPRAFAIEPRGEFVYVANQNSNSIDCYRLDVMTGGFTFAGPTTSVPAPACVMFGPNVDS